MYNNVDSLHIYSFHLPINNVVTVVHSVKTIIIKLIKIMHTLIICINSIENLCFQTGN